MCYEAFYKKQGKKYRRRLVTTLNTSNCYNITCVIYYIAKSVRSLRRKATPINVELLFNIHGLRRRVINCNENGRHIVRSGLISNNLLYLREALRKQRCKINRDTESIQSEISASSRLCVGKKYILPHTPNTRSTGFVPLPARFTAVKTGPKC